MRYSKTIAVTATLALAAAGTGAAVAAAPKAPSKVNVIAVDKQIVKINRYVQSDMRWNKDSYTIKSGGTLHLVNQSKQEPHSFSIVKASDLPKNAKQVNGCDPSNPKTICAKIAAEHQVDPQTQQPKLLVVDKGKPGADTVYDSWFLAPGGKLSIKVSAKPGTVLHFFCAIHPWMQAKILVK